MTYKRIPDQVKLGGTVMTVRRVARCDSNSVGEMCLAAGYIEIADRFNKDDEQTESSKLNTFYHELVHAILDTMGEHDLSKNEKFVSCFAGFMTDAMDKAVFEVDAIDYGG